MTLRSVRLLRDHLFKTEDWDAAGHTYAEEQYRHFSIIQTLEDWYRSMFLETGPAADARRAKALPLIAQDGARIPDLFGLGPEADVSETDRLRFWGQDVDE